jgi:exonuclease SbcC
MIINHIKLKNFGCIKSFDRDFGKGIFIFAGDNGNGKTTVFKAVTMALFDSYDGTMSEYVNWDAEEFDIAIDFEHHGFRYSVTLHQSLKSKTSDREVVDFHNSQSYKGQEAKDFLKKIFDVELIKAAMLSLEQQLDVITVEPSKRRDYLKKIYDLEFKNQQSLFAEQLAALATKTTEITTELNLLRKKEYKEVEPPALPLTESEYASAQGRYAEKVERMGKIKAELERYNQVKKTISDLEAEAVKISGEIAGVESDVREKETQIAALPAESAARSDKAQHDVESADAELIGLEAPDPAVSELETRISAIEVARVGIFNAEDMSAVRMELLKAEQQEKALEGGVCPTCGLSKPKTAETEKELAELKTKIPELQSQIADLKAESERITKIHKENQDKKDLKTKLEHEKELLVERRETRKREAQSMKASAAMIRDSEKLNLKKLLAAANSGLAETLKLLEMKKTAKSDAEQRLDKAKSETLTNPGDELLIVQQEISMEKAKLDEYQRILTEREAVIRQQEQQKKQKEEDRKRIGVLDIELQEKSRETAEIENSQKILKNEFPVYVISRIVKDLETSMNDFLRRVYGGRYTIKLEDKKNSLRMVYGPKSVDAGSGSSSGYEKSIFSLAWKWALSKIQNNRTLMMDEVDSAASQSNSLIFYKTIGDSSKLFDQILIVSHKEQTRELLENDYNAQVLTFTGGMAA